MDHLRAGWIALALAVLAVPVHAQNREGDSTDFVNVSISDHEILNDLASALDVGVSQIPGTVQVPVRVAAQVCGVEASQLKTGDLGSEAICEATTTSSAFRAAVQEQLIKE